MHTKCSQSFYLQIKYFFSNRTTASLQWVSQRCSIVQEQRVGQDDPGNDLEAAKPVKVLGLVPSGWTPGLVRWWADGGLLVGWWRWPREPSLGG